MDLPDFLLARIAEDEAYAKVKLRLEGEPSTTSPDGGDLAGFLQRLIEMCGEDPETQRMMAHVEAGMRSPTDPMRVLADCDAKRRMLKLHGFRQFGHQCVAIDGPTQWHVGDPCTTVRLLALPYAAHPDYDPDWKPTG